jgi:hypothetical protein
LAQSVRQPISIKRAVDRFFLPKGNDRLDCTQSPAREIEKGTPVRMALHLSPSSWVRDGEGSIETTAYAIPPASAALMAVDKYGA